VARASNMVGNKYRNLLIYIRK